MRVLIDPDDGSRHYVPDLPEAIAITGSLQEDLYAALDGLLRRAQQGGRGPVRGSRRARMSEDQRHCASRRPRLTKATELANRMNRPPRANVP
jgi:hypothetical protein